MKHLFVILIWFPITLVTLFFSLGYYSFNQNKFPAKKNVQAEETIPSLNQIPYRLYSSLPQVLGAQTVNAFYIEAQDIIPELVQDYLINHHSPMAGSAEELVVIARKYKLDPLFLVAIAQCESNLGKKMPTNCHNPFGWGIHSQGTLCFDTWQEGYETISKGLRDKYFNQGLTNPEDIMRVYTPPALQKNGSWAKCVNQFLQELKEYQDQM